MRTVRDPRLARANLRLPLAIGTKITASGSLYIWTLAGQCVQIMYKLRVKSLLQSYSCEAHWEHPVLVERERARLNALLVFQNFELGENRRNMKKFSVVSSFLTYSILFFSITYF